MYNQINLFNLPHSLYIFVSFALSALGLVLLARFCKTQKNKDLVLKLSALVTVAIHYSDLWVNYLKNGSATIENNQLFPVYPCNVIMWLLLITAFWKNKHSVSYTLLTESTFWVGSICGIAGILFNPNYSNNPNLLDYGIFQGLFSHSTMVFGCVWILVGGYIRIRVFNAVSAACCLLLFFFDGIFINALFDLCGLPSVNSMFLQELPFPSLPFLNPIAFGITVLLVFFGALALYEWKAFPPEQRWYAKLSAKFNENQTKDENL